MCQQWQPIKTAPRDGRSVLVSNREYVKLAYWSNAKIWDEDEEYYDHYHWVIHEVEDDYYYSSHLVGKNEPTHWKPLPEPPKE